MNRTGLKEQADKQPTLVMALADHITGAVQRAQRHVNIAYPLQAEVQSLYASEYAQASRLVNELNRHLNGVLPGSEAVALALHLVNAGFANGDLSDTYKMTGVIQQMLTIIEQTYGVSLDQHSVNVGRFITHYRNTFFRPDKRNGQVVFSYKPLPGAEEQIYEAISDITISMKRRTICKCQNA